MSQPTLEIRPLRSAITPDGGVVELLIRAVAPKRPENHTTPSRPVLDLALVIDRSGSMDGEPLREAKNCARHILERLDSRDQASLIVYDNRIQTLVPLRPAQPIDPFLAAMNGLESGGSTDLFGGWDGGRGSLGAETRAESLKRILLLSDGCANQGLTDPDAIARHCGDALENGIGTTTIGLGRHFNEELMSRMATAGGGRAYYGERAEDLLDAFTEEFALLSNLHSRRLNLRLKTEPGVRIVSVAGRPAPTDGRIALPDVAWDAVSWVQVTLDANRSEAVERLLATAVLEGESDGGKWTSEPVSLVLPVVEAAVWATLPEDPEVADRVTDTRVGALLESARTALQRGDIDDCRRLLGVARGLATKSQWLLSSIAALERLLEEDREIFAKEALFARGKMASRLVARHDFEPNPADPDPAYLATKNVQGRRRDR